MCERCTSFPDNLDSSMKRHKVLFVSTGRNRIFDSWSLVFQDYGIDPEVIPRWHVQKNSIKRSKPALVVLDSNEAIEKVIGDEKGKKLPYIVAIEHPARRKKAFSNISTDLISEGAEQVLNIETHPRLALAHVRAILARVDSPGGLVKKGEGILRFDDVDIDFSNYSFTREGKEIKLPKKCWEMLSLLASREGEILSARFLMGEIPDVRSPGDASLLVLRLREAFGQTKDGPQYIKTFPRKGYKFSSSPKVPK